MAELSLHVPDIDEAGKDYVFALRSAWLSEVLGEADVRVDEAGPEAMLKLHAQKQGADVVIHGRVTAALVVECARCLEPAHVAVDAEIGALLTARGEGLRPEPDEVVLSPEELDRELFSGDDIVLDEMVREQILLEIPIKPLCREDCPGIPVASQAGARERIDPRLAPLLKLVGKLPTEE